MNVLEPELLALKQVVLVPTSTANLASVVGALRRAGAVVSVCTSAEQIVEARFVVLPGVGAFGAAMQSLAAAGWVDALRARLAAGKPTLGICLGMQLMLEASEESPGVPGLGIVAGTVRRFEAPAVGDGFRVPHMNWARVSAIGRPSAGISSGEAYFAHSYRVSVADVDANRWEVGSTNYGGVTFAAMLRSRAAPGILLCQFHPELSGWWGAELLRGWLGNPVPATPAEGDIAAAPPARGPNRIIPCLDVRDGRIVKGVRFAGLRDAGDPAERAALYADEGADELVMLDVSAGPEGRGACLLTIEAIRRGISIPLCVGGGVRSVDDAKAMLDAGADKVAINSAAVRDPSLIGELAERFGRQCVVAAIDSRRTTAGLCAQSAPWPEAVSGEDAGRRPAWQVVVASGTQPTGRDVVAWAAEVARLGAGEILLTSFDRDGTGAGYDLELLRAVSGATSVPIIASGGASAPEHLLEAITIGRADAVLAASIFHDGRFTCATLRQELARLVAGHDGGPHRAYNTVPAPSPATTETVR